MNITPAQEREQIAKIKSEASEDAVLELRMVLTKLKQQMFNDYITLLFH